MVDPEQAYRLPARAPPRAAERTVNTRARARPASARSSVAETLRKDKAFNAQLDAARRQQLATVLAGGQGASTEEGEEEGGGIFLTSMGGEPG